MPNQRTLPVPLPEAKPDEPPFKGGYSTPAVKNWDPPREQVKKPAEEIPYSGHPFHESSMSPWVRYGELVGQIRDARVARSMTIREVAQAANVAPSAVSNLESLATWPRLSTVEGVAGAVGLQLMFDGEQDVLEQVVLDFEKLRDKDADDPGNLFWLAKHSGLRPNTVYDLVLRRTKDPRISTVIALLGRWDRLHELELRPQS